jgi:hypothetical protein
MAGTLTLGGMADGLLVGQETVGPLSMNGKRAIGKIEEVTLEANVDYTIKVPSEAVAYAISFTFTTSSPEVKIGSNLVMTTNGMPVPSQGFFAAPLLSTITELKFKAATPPSAFQLIFI